MRRLGLKQMLIILVLGLVGYAGCAAIMGIGMAVTTLQTTLIVHAIGAPVIFAAISWIYFTKFKYTTPMQTALVFFSIIIFLDFFLVALLINRSLEMFKSPLGTWLPFALIFLSTYLTGIYVEAQSRENYTTQSGLDSF